MKVVEITHAGNKKTVNKSVVCQNSDRKVANREMGLPVARIMEEVEHELLHMNDELSDEVDANIEVEEEDDNMEKLLEMCTHLFRTGLELSEQTFSSPAKTALR